MYAILVYMIGTASFKLIDAVPNFILRYMGASVKTFNDERGVGAENLQRNVVAGGSAISGKLQEAGKSLGQAGDQGIKSVASGELQNFANRFGGGDKSGAAKNNNKQGDTE
jgi:type IV secretory pathway TrbL component